MTRPASARVRSDWRLEAGGWRCELACLPGCGVRSPASRVSPGFIASHASSENVARPPNRCSTTISGLSSKRHGPHAEQSLEDHQADECDRQRERLFRIVAVRDRQTCEHQDHEAQRRGEIPMHHFLDGLVILEGPLRKRRIDRVDVASGVLGREVSVTPGPVRAAETRRAQSHPRSQHDDDEREHGAPEREAAKPDEIVGFVHAARGAEGVRA